MTSEGRCLNDPKQTKKKPQKPAVAEPPTPAGKKKPGALFLHRIYFLGLTVTADPGIQKKKTEEEIMGVGTSCAAKNVTNRKPQKWKSAS